MSITNPYVKFGLHGAQNGENWLISLIFQTSNTLGGHSHSLKENVDSYKWSVFLKTIRYISKQWSHPLETLWIIQIGDSLSAEDLYKNLYDPKCFEGFVVVELEPSIKNIEGHLSVDIWNWIKGIQSEQRTETKGIQ